MNILDSFYLFIYYYYYFFLPHQSVNDSSSLLAKTPSQDVLAPGKMDSGNLTCTSSVRVDHLQISFQMAPSWIEKYGTFKNGQMLSTHDARKYSTLKTIEQWFSLGNSSDTARVNNMMERENASDSNHAGNIWQRSIPATEMVENFLSSHLTAQDAADKGPVVARQKKCKNTETLPSWQREVTQSSQDLKTSMADIEWAQETSRLIEKVEVEPAFENAPPEIRSKRQLIFTTQLMQQLFRPPVAAALYADAYSNYEAVACMGARIALVDACSLVPRSSNDSHAPFVSINSLTDKLKTNESERISGQHIVEVTEHFVGRAKKMESDFVRDMQFGCRSRDTPGTQIRIGHGCIRVWNF